MKKKTKTPARADGQTQISIALPVWLVDAIETQAGKENRNRSNWLSCLAVERLETLGYKTQSLTCGKRSRKAKK